MQGETDQTEETKALKEFTLQQFSDKETSSDDSSEKEEWDAETILTTLTNTDNHPTTIKYTPKVKVTNAIVLHK